MTRIPIDDPSERSDVADAADEPASEAGAQSAEIADRAAGTDGAAVDVQKLEAERDSLYERLVRMTADAKNGQKRLQTEADQRVQYANQALIKSLIPVIDNFERALAVDPSKATTDSVLKGLQLVHDQWLSVLKQQNVNEIIPKPGDPFDATRHEALMQQDAPQYAGAGTTVVQVLQKGYGLGDRVLRPAQVAVSRST